MRWAASSNNSLNSDVNERKIEETINEDRTIIEIETTYRGYSASVDKLSKERVCRMWENYKYGYDGLVKKVLTPSGTHEAICFVENDEEK